MAIGQGQEAAYESGRARRSELRVEMVGSADFALDVARSQRVSARRRAFDAVLKRTLDVVVAVALLLLLIPVLALVAVAVKLESPGPLLYRCRRPGFGGRAIEVLKFRKMRDGSRGGALTVGLDERFTRIGNVLARTRLDELPQLWNVLRGDMSLVGPRPEDPAFVEQHGPEFDRILRVRPGITGLSQLAFAREREILDDVDPTGDYTSRILPQKIHLDTLYAHDRTLALDLKILVWTFLMMATSKQVSVDRGSARLSIRRRDPSRSRVA